MKNSTKEKKIKILGVSLGSPYTPETYSGVPYYLFAELQRLGCLKNTLDSYKISIFDWIRGAVDFKASIKSLSFRRNALWRFQKTGMKIISKRFRKNAKLMPAHDVVFQIGVGATPKDGVPLVAHVEISVRTAIQTEIFAKNYGFHDHNREAKEDAIKGEKKFLERCCMVWTNSEWTAKGILEQGIDSKKIFVHPPGAGIDDPGLVERNWNNCHILFVGVDWSRKGGPLLMDAFRQVQRSIPNARLSIVGCKPKIKMNGVDVVGYLRKNIPEDRRRIDDLYKRATIFCMPSYWESTGLVYTEAALWGLPVVMLKGQGREEIFPESMAIHLETADASVLAEQLIRLNENPKKMREMGTTGRNLALNKHTWKKLAPILYEEIKSRIYA